MTQATTILTRAAPLPQGVTHPVKRGNGVRVRVVYYIQYQLIPYQRVQEQLHN
jgi:hypothetical protein